MTRLDGMPSAPTARSAPGHGNGSIRRSRCADRARAGQLRLRRPDLELTGSIRPAAARAWPIPTSCSGRFANLLDNAAAVSPPGGGA